MLESRTRNREFIWSGLTADGPVIQKVITILSYITMHVYSIIVIDYVYVAIMHIKIFAPRFLHRSVLFVSCKIAPSSKQATIISMHVATFD